MAINNSTEANSKGSKKSLKKCLPISTKVLVTTAGEVLEIDQGVIKTMVDNRTNKPTQTKAVDARRIQRLGISEKSSCLLTSIMAKRIKTLIAPT